VRYEIFFDYSKLLNTRVIQHVDSPLDLIPPAKTAFQLRREKNLAAFKACEYPAERQDQTGDASRNHSFTP
jgi:hypothetical protein